MLQNIRTTQLRVFTAHCSKCSVVAVSPINAVSYELPSITCFGEFNSVYSAVTSFCKITNTHEMQRVYTFLKPPTENVISSVSAAARAREQSRELKIQLSIAKPGRYAAIYPGKTMLKSLPCVKSNSRSSPIRIMEHSAHSFSPDLSSIVSESLGQQTFSVL